MPQQESDQAAGVIARRGVLTGRVQGVAFRYFVYRRACESGIRGWVRNLPDGAVEVHLEGETDRVRKFQPIVEKGSPMAKVIESRWRDVPVAGYQGFEITF